MRPARARGWVAVAVFAACLLPAARAPRAQPTDEAEVQAAYVVNFVRYSRWPEPAAAYVIATLGSPESANELRALVRRVGAVDGHPLAVRALSLNSTPPERARAIVAIRAGMGDACVLFVPASHQAWNAAAIAASTDRPVLTVGVGPGFVAQGGMFALITEGNRVRFAANDAAIRRSGVEVSARVLLLARPLAPHGG